MRNQMFLMMGILASGCGDGPRPRTETEQPEEVVPAACAGRDAKPGELARLDDGVGEIVGFAACGDLAWIDGAGTLRLAGPDLSTDREVARGAETAAFDPAGARLLWRDDAAIRVAPLDGAGRELAATGDGFAAGGFVGDAAWTCAEGTLVVDAEPVAEAVDCGSVRARGASLVFVDDDRNLRGYAGGAVRRLAGLTWRQFDEGRYHVQERVELSPDGRLLIHRQEIQELCGDTFCFVPEGMTTVVEVATGRRVAEIPAVAPGEGGTSWDDPAFLAAGGALVFPGRDGDAWLVDAELTAHRLEGVRPLRLLRDGRAVLGLHRAPGDRFSRLVRADAVTGDLATVAENADAFAVSRDERTVVVSRSTGRCIHYPDRPDVCHTQVWALVRWTEDEGAVEVAVSDQPMRPYWVGDDGTILVGGGLWFEPVPEVAAEAPPVEPGLHLLAPDGALRATLGAEDRPHVLAAAGRLLVVRRPDRRTLDVIDPTDGRTRRLLTADAIALAVGPGGRLAVLADGALHAGALPAP